MAESDICLLPATDLAGLVAGRSISSRELLTAYLARIESRNPRINAVVTLDAERALEEAARLDDDTASGRSRGPLHGLPCTIKDAIEVAGIRSTGGSPDLRDHIPTVDAPVVSRLKAAGAVVFGKTNVPKWSGDIQTYNEIFGTTSNPWDPTRTPGGSSGGPAAAVAAGLTAFEVGTDIGGSIRIPSGYCGVTGHKPSFGLVSQKGYLDHVGGGVIDADINVFGPIARANRDLETLLEVLSGPDADRAGAWSVSLPPPRHDTIGSYRVGLWLDDPACRVDSSVLGVLQAAAKALADAGATVEEAKPPLELAEMYQLFMSLVLPAVSLSEPEAIGSAMAGSHRDWLLRNRERELVRRVWADWFVGFDALLCPIMPMAPFPHDQGGTVTDRRVVINGESRTHGECLAWTGLVGVAYLPSTAAPAGFTPEGLPVGVQVVGPYMEDLTPLFVARSLEDATGGFRPPPNGI